MAQSSFAFFIAILHVTGVVSETVVIRTDFPNVKYILKNQDARLECRIIKSDGSIEEPPNTLWYRIFSNTSDPYQFSSSHSNRVVAHKNTLVFWPTVISSDQGQYYCCLPNGKCSGHVNVTFFAAPVIKAVKLNYTAFIGSHAMFACEIVYWGNPKVVFYWKTPQEESVSNDLVQTNSTHTSLLMSNLTEQDSGRYACIADAKLYLYGKQMFLYLQVSPKISIDGPMIAHIGEVVSITCNILEGRPLPDIRISSPLGEFTENHEITFFAEVRHTGHYTCTANISTQVVTEDIFLLVYDTNNAASSLQFLAIIHNSDCHSQYETFLSAILKSKIYDICKCHVNISTERFECISDRRALYYVNVTGTMAGNIKEFLISEELDIEIDSDTAALHICNPQCEEVDVVDHQNDNHDQNDDHDHNRIAMWMASSAVVILLLIIIIFVMYKLLNGVSECVARKEIPTADTPNPLARNPVTTFQQSHLTKETIPEDNIAVPTNEDVVVPSSSVETLSRIQSNGTITTISKQPTQQRRTHFTQVDRNDGLEVLRYERMIQRVTRDFASTGTDV